jgi:tetratricopeptide (TPR) repeat protein
MCIGSRFKRVIGHRSFRPRYLVAVLTTLFFIAGMAPAQRERSGSEAQADRGAASAFADAESLLSSGRIQEAKEKVQEELRAHPSSVDGYNLLGIVCTQSKDYACAESAFDRALKLDPASTHTRNNRGNLLVGEGKPALAEKEFREVLAIAPANRDANYNLGLLLLARGAPGKAITYFLRVHPPDFETRFNLVRAYLRSGNTNAGLNGAAKLSAENKSNVALHFTLGTILAAERQYKPAELEFEKANALQPETFEILYNLGEVYLRAKQYSQAELVFSRALKLKAGSAETLYLLAQVYFDESRPVDALDLLVRAHKIAPDNTDVIFLMARVSMNQNFYEDAIPLLESGLKIAPQRADLHAALGESYFMSGKTEKAIEEFQKLIQLDPSARSYVFMGLSYRHLGRFDDARKYFQDGLKRDPHNASCLFNLGFIEEHQGNVARADELFHQALSANPDFSDALLETANLRMKDKKFAEAADLLRHYVKVSRDPASGYYKLAMAERGMHQMAAAQRDLSVFQTLSKDSSTGPYPYQHLFDYLDSRSKLSSSERNQLDISELTEQMKKHPGQPQDFYLLAESYLKLGKKDEALATVAQLDAVSADDYRMQTGVGVLLARYRLYDDAIRHFQTALHVNPDSDDVKYDLAAAYFRKGLYREALDSAQTVSAAGQKDDTYLALLGDIYAHVGDTPKSVEIFASAIDRNPDNDQYYLSLALAQLRAQDLNGAEQTLKRGSSRIPASGKLLWGLGLISVLQGNAAQAAERLERAVELLPEWAGSYSTLGVFYYETGQIDKAREVLNRFKGSNAGGLDVNRIEAALSQAPAQTPAAGAIPMVARQQLLQLALSIADRTL